MVRGVQKCHMPDKTDGKENNIKADSDHENVRSECQIADGNCEDTQAEEMLVASGWTLDTFHVQLAI
jgi:hypothetical protein